MGFTKKQCREQKKAHFARKIYHKNSPKGTTKEKQSSLPKEMKEPAGPAHAE
jgi:hypothetical protein